jgi:phage terminase large subunit-like protein
MGAATFWTANSLALLPLPIRHRILASLTDDEIQEFLFDWLRWARPEQLPPTGNWRTWLVLAGRGFGKTRTGAEWVRARVESGRARRIALVAPTAADARDVMVEGESGLLSICPEGNKPVYEPTKRRLTWPNGALATTYSADEPERLRGPQHDHAWCDEVGSWRRPQAWDNLQFGLRLGDDPRTCVTTTPKRTTLVKALLEAKTTVRTKGSSYDNRANLAPAFFDEIIAAYEGTRLGLQEIHAELSEIVDGAWFPGFSMRRNVDVGAEWIPGVPVRLAIDCGTSFHTGAVFFQVREMDAHRFSVNVFADYYAEGLYSRANAEAIQAVGRERCSGRLDAIRLDPAGSHRTGIGPTVSSEYDRVFGSRSLSPWPLLSVTDGLDLIETLLGSETRDAELIIHPRCVHLIEAFKNYQRANSGGEWLDRPKDPQHPQEDLMDALRGGLQDRFPEGRRPAPVFRWMQARGGRLR